MFTGIIQTTAQVSRFEKVLLCVSTGFKDLELGESVAVNGVCLTVAEVTPAGEALFHVSPETLACTNLSSLTAGALVNLERALKVSDRLSGHIVQGHVDGLGRITRLDRDGDCWILECELPPELSRYCISKGSIAINGVSLTINTIKQNQISIQLIPHTFSHTEFCNRRTGDPINIEVDVLAKYVERLTVGGRS